MPIDIYKILESYEIAPEDTIDTVLADENPIKVIEQLLTMKFSNNDTENVESLVDELMNCFEEHDPSAILDAAIISRCHNTFYRLVHNQKYACRIAAAPFQYIISAATFYRFDFLVDILNIAEKQSELSLCQLSYSGTDTNLCLNHALYAGHLPLIKKLINDPKIAELERHSSWQSFQVIPDSAVNGIISLLIETVPIKEIISNPNLLDLFMRPFYNPSLIKDSTDDLYEFMYHFAKEFWHKLSRVPKRALEIVQKGRDLYIEKIRICYNFNKAFGNNGAQVADRVLSFLPGYREIILKKVDYSPAPNIEDDVEMADAAVGIGAGAGAGAGAGSGASVFNYDPEDIDMDDNVVDLRERRFLY